MTGAVVENLCSLVLSTPGFDDLLLTGATVDSDGREFAIEACEVSEDDTGEPMWGSPQPIDTAVQRWMTDGAIAATQNHENREISLQIVVSADTSADLAAGEAALALRASKPASLIWTPPEGDSVAPQSVFEVWTWHLEHGFSGLDERDLERGYTVSMTAKPWVRSLDLTTSEAVPTGGTPTTVEVDGCSSVTGWTGSPNTPTLAGGVAVRESKAESGFGFPRTVTRTLTRTGSVTGMDTTPYLILDTATSPSGPDWAALTVKVDGQTCAKVSQTGSVSYWQVPASMASFTTLTVTATFTALYALTYRLDVRDVSRTDTVGVSGTHKMLNRHLDVGGSVKTSGSIHVASPSATVLGDTLIYTCPDIGNGYTPPLRPYRTSGGTVSSDGSAVSGSTETFITAGGTSVATINYSIPGSSLREGTYVVVVKPVLLYNAGTITLTYGGGTNGVTGLPPVSTTTGPIPLAGQDVTTLGAAWLVAGTIDLPTYARPGESTQDQRFFIYGTSDGNGQAISLDEVFLFDITRGALTFARGLDSLGQRVQFTQLWLDSPDFGATNRPQIYCGSNADRSDALAVPYGQIVSLGDHDLDPNGSMVFTVTEHVDDAVVTASYYHRWHTHAGD